MTFSASEARKTAESNKNQISDVDHLFNHFMQLIKRESNKGKFEIEKQTFTADRFKPSVIDDVVAKLQEHGFKVLLGKNNALNQVIFNVSW